MVLSASRKKYVTLVIASFLVAAYTMQHVANAEPVTTYDNNAANSIELILPNTYRLIRGYSYEEKERFKRGWHRGVDVAPQGKVVSSATHGEVFFVGAVANKKIVTVSSIVDGEAVNVTYTGLDEIDVKAGDTIIQNQTIGQASDLHIGVYSQKRRSLYFPIKVSKPTLTSDSASRKKLTVISGNAGDRDSRIAAEIAQHFVRLIESPAVIKRRLGWRSLARPMPPQKRVRNTGSHETSLSSKDIRSTRSLSVKNTHKGSTNVLSKNNIQQQSRKSPEAIAYSFRPKLSIARSAIAAPPMLVNNHHAKVGRQNLRESRIHADIGDARDRSSMQQGFEKNRGFILDQAVSSRFLQETKRNSRSKSPSALFVNFNSRQRPIVNEPSSAKRRDALPRANLLDEASRQTPRNPNRQLRDVFSRTTSPARFVLAILILMMLLHTVNRSEKRSGKRSRKHSKYPPLVPTVYGFDHYQNALDVSDYSQRRLERSSSNNDRCYIEDVIYDDLQYDDDLALSAPTSTNGGWVGMESAAYETNRL